MARWRPAQRSSGSVRTRGSSPSTRRGEGRPRPTSSASVDWAARLRAGVTLSTPDRLARRKDSDLEPEAVDRLAEPREVVEVERLDHVAVDAAVVARGDVARGG